MKLYKIIFIVILTSVFVWGCSDSSSGGGNVTISGSGTNS